MFSIVERTGILSTTTSIEKLEYYYPSNISRRPFWLEFSVLSEQFSLAIMSKEFRDDPSFKPWGPLISPDYVNEAITKSDIIIASVVWALTLVNVLIAIYLIYGQTRGSRSPLRSVYVWMIWLELVISFVMGLQCFLHLLKYIRPSKQKLYRYQYL